MKQTTKITLDLSRGDVVSYPATLNSHGFTGSVAVVEPWILSAGPHAGQQATTKPNGKGEALYTVKLTDVRLTDSPLQTADLLADSPERHMSATASDTWTVEV